MKTYLRILSLLLSIVMLICMVPHSVLAQIGEELNGTDSDVASNKLSSETLSNKENTAYVLGEVIENRTETTKTFRMSDGSYVVADYAQNIHFADENGTWQDYDNTLSYSDASSYDSKDINGYGTASSDISIKLANNSNSNNLLKITKDNYKVSLHLVDADKSKALEVYEPAEAPVGNDIDSAAKLHKFSSGAVYKDILENTDLEYIISGSSVKENIIVKDKCDTYTYTFELKLHNLVPVLLEDGAVALNDEETGNTVLTIPKGYMYDANGEYSDAVSYSVSHKNGNKYTFTVTADSQWINAEGRAFPVTIDPTVEAFKTTVSTYDSYITQNSPDLNDYLRAEIIAGYYGGNTSKECHALIRPASLPTLPDSSVIVNAEMRLHHMPDGTEHTSVNIAAVQITSAWDSNNVTWNTKPSYATTDAILDYRTMTSESEGEYVSFDITRLAQQWYNGTAENYGVALVPISGAGVGRIYFGSSDYNAEVFPQMLISYRDTKGLENIWTYSSHSVGNAGVGYVNGYNGNLVFAHGDIATQGSIIPISVSHVYNGYLANRDFTPGSDVDSPVTADYSNMLVGLGWKLSVQESITTVIIDNKTWYVYNDSDGTEHYFFVTENGEIVSEDGYGLTITVTGTGIDTLYTLKDEYGNEKRFDDSGRLIRITDSYGNRKTFEYEYNRLVRITYTYKIVSENSTENVTETQLTFEYNSQNALKKIVNAYDTTDYVEFLYSETVNGTASVDNKGYLRKIIYSNGAYSTYEYSEDGKLLNAVDGDTNYKITYSYTNNNVSSVTESVNGTVGQTVGYVYGDNSFNIRTSGKDDTYGNSDDILNHFLFDNYGRAFCSYSTDVTGNTVYGTSYVEYTATSSGAKTNNKIKTDSVKGTTAENIIPDNSFESSSAWTLTRSGTGLNGGTSTNDALYGNKSYLLASNTNNSGYVESSLNVSVSEAGTYTFSAYVKTINVDAANGGGAYIVLDNAESEKIEGTTNANIQNGWQRISVTKEFASAGTYTVKLKLENAMGYAFFDCVQLEKGETPSSYNFIQNSSVNGTTSWSGSFTTLSTEIERGHVGRIIGSPSAQISASQTINLNLPVNSTFMLSGWAKASSVDLSETDEEKINRKFGLKAVITYSDNTTEEHYVSFNPDNVNWQYAALAVVPKTTDESLTVSSVTVSAVYDYNANTMYFDDICLTVEPAQTYVYDEDGNLKTATDALGNDSMLDYVENQSEVDLFTSVTGEVYDYIYSDENKHQLDSVTKTAGGITQTLNYAYDSFGNVISSTLSASGTNETVTSSATYSTDGNYLLESINSLGSVTKYNYDTVTKLLKYVENANGKQTAYIYDTRDRVSSVYLDTDKDGVKDTYEYAVEYLYAQNRLSSINTATTQYTLMYDAFGNMLSIKAGDNTLATYTYSGNNGKLQRLEYGNGDFEAYEYDHLDRLIKVYYNGNEEASYFVTFDTNGRISSVKDGNITHIYEYDSLGRLIRAYQKNNNGTTLLAVENTYDEYGRALGSTYVAGDKTMSYTLSYKTDSSLVSSISMPSAVVSSGIAYTYDEFDRLISKDISLSTLRDFYTDYEYYTYTKTVDEELKTFTTALVSKLTLSVSSNGTAETVEYGYTYDKLGNILKITKNGTVINEYEYDALGQLVCEEYPVDNLAYVYTYDKSGNITGKYEFPYYQGTLAGDYLNYLTQYKVTLGSYTYSNSSWGDMLTNYNGTAITYDAIGNPNNWRNAISLSWAKRELTSLTLAQNETLSFTYNSSGIRTQKNYINYNEQYSVTHNYLLDGTNIIREEIVTSSITGASTEYLYYLYDSSGIITGFIYNNNPFYFQKNLQGDIVRILNPAGAVVTEYTYDAWGNVLSVTGSLATTIGQINPFRYRGYYYDTETGFYYLQSRYYDPTVGRFLNADCIIGANGGILGYNMFAYCNNNPVMGCDPSGHGFFDDVGDWFNDKVDDACDWIEDTVDDVCDWVDEEIIEPVVEFVDEEIIEPVGNFINNVEEDIDNFSFSNKDEKVVLKSNYFSFYKGVLVIRTNGERSGSFGVIFLSHEDDHISNAEDVVRHEYGHTKQLEQLGVIKYALYIGLPSWQNWGTGDYYSKPWEITADIYGGVQSRNHSSKDIVRGFSYLRQVKQLA